MFLLEPVPVFVCWNSTVVSVGKAFWYPFV
jgi:hypothetical protein